MLKLLTLNLHSWLEIHQISKIYQLAQFIAAEKVDVVALQEVNQFIHSPRLSDPAGYLGQEDIRQDNTAHLLNTFLTELTGQPYYWTWAVAHLGFERYDEGVAILTRQRPLASASLDLSPAYSYYDVPRRVAVAAQLDAPGQPWVASTHMSWWTLEGTALFEHEFTELEGQMKALAGSGPIILAGDFNNAAEVRAEGYDLMRQRGWLDTYQQAQEPVGSTTVHKAIHGWDNLSQALRIDLALTDRPQKVSRHQVIFPDQGPEAISDHSGLLVSFEAYS